MDKEEYNKKFKELKEAQTPWLKKYNGTKSKPKKKEYYAKLMEYELKLWNLELLFRKK